MKKTLLTLLAICATTQAFAFPDISKYRHTRVPFENGQISYVTSFDHPAELNYTKYRNMYGYSGTCPVTGYTLWINDDKLIDTECMICKDDGVETSYATEETTSGVRYTFEHGRIFVWSEKGQIKAIMQSF